MNELKWNEYDFIECLGSLPEIDQYDDSYWFTVKKDSITVKVNLIYHFGVVGIHLFTGNQEFPIISLQFIVRDEIFFLNNNEFSYLLFKDCVLISDGFYSVENYKATVSDKNKILSHLNFELHTFPKLQLKFS